MSIWWRAAARAAAAIAAAATLPAPPWRSHDDCRINNMIFNGLNAIDWCPLDSDCRFSPKLCVIADMKGTFCTTMDVKKVRNHL